MAISRGSKGKPIGIFGAVVGIAILVAIAVLQQRGVLSTSSTPTPSGSPTSTSSTAPSEAVSPVTAKAVNANSLASIRIGAWNIEWLGRPEDRSGQARDIAQRPGDLAEYILSSGVSVLAVEEIIATVNGKPPRSRELEDTLVILKRQTGDDWEYVLFPGRQDGDQLTGVVWNATRVTALDSSGGDWDQLDTPWGLPIVRGRSAQGSSLWNRPPHAMKFSTGNGKSDFVVVVLHMKADYQGAFADHRNEEAGSLVRALGQVRSTFKDADIVLLGDTNCTEPNESAIDVLEKAGFHDTNTRQAPTHWRGGAMDKIFTPVNQPEFQSSTLDVESDARLNGRRITPAQFKQLLSDHYMVVTAIQIVDDDD